MRLPTFIASLCLMGASAVWAQGAVAPALSASAPAVQSVAIQDVRPEASAEPGYAQQTNAERAMVQPGNNAPLWRQVGAGVSGVSSLPVTQAPEAGNLIQPTVQYPGMRATNAGEAWRAVRNRWIIPYGGSLLLITLGAIVAFYLGVGTIRLHEPATGRMIERFTPFERSAHMANAAAFTVLAISGLVMAFGKFILLPVIGTTLFGWLTYALKNAHNFAGPLFAVSLVIVIATFIRDNLPAKGDLNWLLKGGGMLSEHEIKSGRFNAGEKVIFWAGVFVAGLVVVGSGLVMDKLIPGLVYERGTMQLVHMVHATAAMLMLVLFMGHIYLGTLGTEGAFQGMQTGYVDASWAKQHHELWYDDIEAGRIPAQRSKTPQSPTPQAPARA